MAADYWQSVETPLEILFRGTIHAGAWKSSSFHARDLRPDGEGPPGKSQAGTAGHYPDSHPYRVAAPAFTAQSQHSGRVTVVYLSPCHGYTVGAERRCTDTLHQAAADVPHNLHSHRRPELSVKTRCIKKGPIDIPVQSNQQKFCPTVGQSLGPRKSQVSVMPHPKSPPSRWSTLGFAALAYCRRRPPATPRFLLMRANAGYL